MSQPDLSKNEQEFLGTFQKLPSAAQAKAAMDAQQKERERPKPEFEWATRCRIMRKIADGGMGSVYLAEQLGEADFSKTVVVKLIKADRLQDTKANRMFVDEAKLTADLVHTNIAQVYNLGVFQNRYFIVMEYMHAKTLGEYSKKFLSIRQLPPTDMSAFIVSRVCRGLDYAHTKKDRDGRLLGIVHRDVTPSNIMIDFRGAVKLTDFGIAKALTMNMPDETKVIMGKFPYMSPEQVGAQATDPRSDIFSLGLILYELLTGTHVYNAKSRAELLEMMNKYRIKDPRKIVPNLPDDLVEITMTALQRDTAKRWQSAFEFGDALEKQMYSKGYGPTNEKLAKHIMEIWPEVDRDKVS
ncbi:MAG: serine/threonine protein kinase [Planctomycetes bacterium]|nr:serine/threonine protein kinase [Planctomycetota bacterium]